MKNGNGELKETIKPGVSEQIAIKLKELSNAPKDTTPKIKEDRFAQKKEADEIAIQQLDKQKVMPPSKLRPQDTENKTGNKHEFKHKVNKEGDKIGIVKEDEMKNRNISFGNGPCARACLRSGVRVGFHSGG